MMEYDGLLSLDHLERAVEKVRDRLLRSTAALEAAGVPYAVIGGNAVMAWVEQADESAVRFTQDVDLVLRREDLDRARVALEQDGFIYRGAAGQCLDWLRSSHNDPLFETTSIVTARIDASLTC